MYELGMQAELEKAMKKDSEFIKRLSTVVVKFSLHYCVIQWCGKIERVSRSMKVTYYFIRY